MHIIENIILGNAKSEHHLKRSLYYLYNTIVTEAKNSLGHVVRANPI